MRRRYIGSDMTQASARQIAESTPIGSPRLNSGRILHPGNAAGLMNQRTARLNHAQGGYLNPANQRARMAAGKNQILGQLPNVPRLTTSSGNGGKLLDKRMTRFTDSSVARITRLLK